MPKRAAGLTVKQVQAISEAGMHADGNGLYLQVTGTGAKTWIYRYMLAGRRRDMGLGGAADVGLAEARRKAADARELVLQGVDPLEERKRLAAQAAAQQARLTTFREAGAAYIESMGPKWTNPKHAAQWTSTLARYAYPSIGNRPVADVDTAAVLSILQPIWQAKTETASRIRGRVEAVLDYAKVRGWRDGENPARWRGHLSLILAPKSAVAPVEHHESMAYADVPAFWPRLQVQDGLGARALELAILTAARSGEVLGATWPEFDLDARTWTIPAERMKARREHRVPLTDPALALLHKLAAIRSGDLLFPGQRRGRPLSNMAMAMTLRRMKLTVTPHGFRSTFRTWAAEQTSFPDIVAELALAHTQDDKVVAAYQRGELMEKRRKLMEAWASFCTTPATGNLVRLTRRALSPSA